LLLAAGAIFAWRWRREGHPWRALMSSPRMMGTSSQTNAAAPAGPQEASTPSPSSSVSPEPIQQTPAADANGPEATPSSSSAASPAAPTASPAVAAAATPVADPPSTRPADTATAARNTTQRSASPPPDDKLVSEGEDYLYGNGVPKNCERARSSLFTAAERDNPAAQSILGTMFATGHCVAVDLPTAYRWLARAERQQPRNAQVTGTMRIVWKEMSSEEQELAVRSSR